MKGLFNSKKWDSWQLAADSGKSSTWSDVCYKQGRRQVCKSGGAGMLLSVYANILPSNYDVQQYYEPQKLGGLQPPLSTPLTKD